MDVQVSSHAWHIEVVEGVLRESLEAVKKLWKEARAHTQDRIDSLEKCLADHDSPGNEPTFNPSRLPCRPHRQNTRSIGMMQGPSAR